MFTVPPQVHHVFNFRESFTSINETDRAVVQVTIRGSHEAVWREITRTDQPQKSMFNMQLVTPGLAVGAPIQMRSASRKYVGVVGEVLEFDPPRRYAHTFKFTRFNDPPCELIFDLKPVSEGTEFTMTLAKLPAGTATAKRMVQGGNLILKTLKATIETGRPTFGIRILYRLFGLLEPLTPKQCLTQNWPIHA